MDFRKLLTGKSRKIVLFIFDVICFILIDLFYYIFALYSHYINAPADGLFIRNSILLAVSVFFSPCDFQSVCQYLEIYEYIC